MRILVTGGSGFIGGAVVQELESQGYNDDITIIDRVVPGYDTKAKFIKHDITKLRQLFLKPFDFVFHCAAILGAKTTFQRIKLTEEVNVLGTLSVLELQKNYGVVIRPGLLGDWLNPYMISTKTAERYGFMYREYMGTKFISIRFTVVYGPGQVNGIAQNKVVPVFTRCALDNKPLEIYGDGNYRVRLLYIRDAARVMIKAAMKYNILPSQIVATSVWDENYISVNDLAEQIIGLTGWSSVIEHSPMRIGQPESAKNAGANLGDAIELFNKLDFTETTFLTEGLLNTIEWMKQCG